MGILCSAILLHSFAHLYWPSLRWGIPIQDYFLSDGLSAHYSFHNAKLYLIHILLFLFPALVILREIQEAELQKILKITLLLMIIPNSILACIQGFWNVNMLAQGSGSAVVNGRAVGFLEDGGASAVYFALLSSALLSALLFSKMDLRKKLLAGILLSLTLLAGIVSGSRAYFVCVFLSGFSILIFYVLRERKIKTLVVSSACAFVLGFVLIKMSPSSLERSFEHLGLVSVSDLLTWKGWDHLFSHIDPVRSFHFKVMLKAFLEHPWKGTGFGSFYSNLYEHAAWANTEGSFLFADPPEFYPMIFSEWGLAGILLLLLLFISFFRKVRALKSEINPITAFFFGLTLSCLISLTMGVHLIFKSFSSLAGLCLAWIVYQKSSPRFSLYVQASMISIFILFLTGIIYQFSTAPRSPAFRWQTREKPQVPNSAYMKEPYTFSEEGVWLSSGAELLLKDYTLHFLIKRPEELYPVKIIVSLYDQKGEKKFVYTQLIQNSKMQNLTITPDKGFVESCRVRIGPDNFCSFRVHTDPEWKLKADTFGVYVLHPPSSVERSMQ